MLAAIVGLIVRFVEQRKYHSTRELVDEETFTFNTDIPPNAVVMVSREMQLPASGNASREQVRKAGTGVFKKIDQRVFERTRSVFLGGQTLC